MYVYSRNVVSIHLCIVAALNFLNNPKCALESYVVHFSSFVRPSAM